MDIGARLKTAREARGLTLDALSRSTRVQHRMLSAIERNDSASLPPRPYGRGFVRLYASEVGLDPDATVRDFFSQFGTTEPAPSHDVRDPSLDAVRTAEPQQWLWPVAAVVGYALVGALVIYAGRWAIQRSSEASAVGTSGTAVPAAAPSTERQPAAATPAPAPAPPPSGIVVTLDVRSISWITASIDGERTLYRMLQPGEQLRLAGERQLNIRIGDAGAVLWQVNGSKPAPMGQSGQVRTVVVTPENAAQMK
jgi:cytoskeletal protein RodZ